MTEKNIKILSFQPESLYATGGSSRILRRIYADHETRVLSLAALSYKLTSTTRSNLIPEMEVFLSPISRQWVRWYLRGFITWLREHLFRRYNIYKIRQLANNMDYDVIHVLNQGSYSLALCENQYKKIWVSFHDHFSVINSPLVHTHELWNRANRRFVISSELGNEYSKLFGEQNFEILTDGILEHEISKPFSILTKSVIVYFAGLLHINYLPLFESLADALDHLSNSGYSFKLLLRGTQELKFLRNRSFQVEYKPVSLNTAELKSELDSASILYMPLSFNSPNLASFSLSTKMVGYLGAKGSILYHGPKNSAAWTLLYQSNAAIGCHSLDKFQLVESVESFLKSKFLHSFSAKKLAYKQFLLNNMQDIFWQKNK